MFRKLAIAAIVAALSSCSYIYGDQGIIKNRDTTYLKSTTVPPLQIPPGLSSSTIQSHYPISDRYYPGSTEKLDLTPPELGEAGPAVRHTRPEHEVTASAEPVNAPVQPQGKSRTIADFFRHGGSSTNVSSNSSAAPAVNNNSASTGNSAVNSVASAQQQHKPRTIQEYFEKGGGPLTNLFGNSNAATQNSAANGTPATNKNTTASAAPSAQPQPPQHKPRTIQEYFEKGGGPLTNLFSGSQSS